MTEAEFLERVRELTPYQLARFAEMLAELVRECQAETSTPRMNHNPRHLLN